MKNTAGEKEKCKGQGGEGEGGVLRTYLITHSEPAVICRRPPDVGNKRDVGQKH